MRALGITLLLLGALASPALSYPIEPQTLRTLSRDAELICVARVVSSTLLVLPARDPWPASRRQVVTLEIQLVLKGQQESRWVRVARDVDTVCPRPARYDLGSTVLAFLERASWLERRVPRQQPLWSTTALSYGSRRIQGPPLESALVKRTREVLELHSQLQGLERREKVAAWFVRCVGHPSTRWDGLWGLRPKIYRPHGSLTGEDRARLRQAIREGKSKREVRKLLRSIRQGPTENPYLGLLKPPHVEFLWGGLRDDVQLLDPGDGALIDLVGKLRPRQVAGRLCQELSSMMRLRLDTYAPGACRFMRKAADLLQWERGRELAESADSRAPWKAVEAFVVEVQEVLQSPATGD